MKIFSILLSFASLALLSPSLLADDNAPAPAPAPTAPATAAAKPVLFEVSKLKGADVQVQEDAAALGGEYVMNKQAYNPVAFIDTPPGDQLTVWARVRGSSFQLKAVVDGKQQELDWVWGTAGQFVWKKFGTYPRAKLGEQFVLIRGDKADPTDGIDAVLVSTDPDFSPDTAKDIESFLAK